MIRKVVVFLLFGLVGHVTLAQSDAGYTIEGDKKGRNGEVKQDWTEKVYLGGGVGGLSFSNNATYVSLSGIGGYRWTEKINTGVGYTYQYTNYKNIDQSLHSHGVNVFTQYMIFNPIFLMAQYEFLSYQALNYDYTTFRANYNSVMLGGGYSKRISNKAAINFYVLYDVTYDVDTSPYGTPWYVGLNFVVGF